MNRPEESPVLDDEAWTRAEGYWRGVVDGILTSTGEEARWPASEPQFYGDGVTPIERESLSVCDGRSWEQDRSFSVRQTPVRPGEPGIVAYVKDYETELLDFPDINTAEDVNAFFEQGSPRNRVPRSTLIVMVEYSDEAVALARSLLAEWLKPDTTVASMRAYIDQAPSVDHW
jgi:hypothetical protein